jgi:hypothetical protein
VGWNLFALREVFQDQSPLLDLGQSASDISSNGDRLEWRWVTFSQGQRLPEQLFQYPSGLLSLIFAPDQIPLKNLQKVDLIVSGLLAFKRV